MTNKGPRAPCALKVSLLQLLPTRKQEINTQHAAGPNQSLFGACPSNGCLPRMTLAMWALLPWTLGLGWALQGLGSYWGEKC